SVGAKFTFDKLVSKLSHKSNFVQDKLLPGWADSKIDKLLFKPKNKIKSDNRVPKGFREETIKTKDGEVQAYLTGTGPTVVFVHGWGGNAYQFMPLMRGLARCGFTALAFDLLGHGRSSAKPTTIQQSIATTNDVLQHVRKNANDGLAAIVGHSTDCISIVNSRDALIKNIPLFLISPIFNYRLFFIKQLVKLKFHPDIVKQYAARFGKIYKKEYENLDLARNLAKYGDIAVIAHDESDSESAVSDSVKFCTRYPLTRLLVTRNFDHSRVINSESVWQELKSTLNYDDTTINFSEVVI
ncbi:MAG: alpha/beta hydrolase, partial [Planctomycetota bacterium]